MLVAGSIKLTPEVLRKLCYAIMRGTPESLACEYAEINIKTFEGWLNVGKLIYSGVTPKQIAANGKTYPEKAAERYSPDVLSDYEEFYLAIAKARATAVVEWLNIIGEAANRGDWKAAAWKLERLYPKIFGKQVQVKQDITSNGEAISNLVNTALIKVYGNSDDRANKIIEDSPKLRLPERAND